MRPLPVPDADLITILSRPSGPLFSYPEYVAYRERSQCYSEMAASMPTESSLDFSGSSRLIAAEAISPS